MTDELRTALNTARPVHTALGVIPVKTLSAIEVVYWADEIMGLGSLIRKEARKLNPTDPDFAGGIGVVCKKYPLSVIGLLGGTTGKKAEELGTLPIEEYLDLVDAFLEKHEAAIERFFGLKDRFGKMMEKQSSKAKVLPSSNLSIHSSPEGGHSATLNDSPSNSSNFTEENPQPEISETNSKQ